MSFYLSKFTQVLESESTLAVKHFSEVYGDEATGLLVLGFLVITPLFLTALLCLIGALFNKKAFRLFTGLLQLTALVIAFSLVRSEINKGYLLKVCLEAHFALFISIASSAFLNIFYPGFLSYPRLEDFGHHQVMEIHMKERYRYNISRALLIVIGILLYDLPEISSTLLDLGVSSLTGAILEGALRGGAYVAMALCAFSTIRQVEYFHYYKGCISEVFLRRWFIVMRMQVR